MLVGLVACGGDDNAADTTASAAPTTTLSTTTSAQLATTTTEADDVTTTTVAETTTTVVAETTTTVPAVPVYPLTGVENPDPAIAARPALVVKIDNAPGARPQTGFNSADIVYEEIVNANITRFAMVFQSGGSNPVGPIRSGRLQDVELFTAYNHPLFAWSGGNRTVTDAVNASDLINVGAFTKLGGGAFFRISQRKEPHNLYATTDALFERTQVYAPPATQQFQYRKADATPQGEPSAGVAMALDSIDVRWEWDAGKGLYFRDMEGRAHIDAGDNVQVNTNNIVVLAVEYIPGISDSPDAQTIGEGEAFVFTGGNYIHATWSRPDKYTPIALIADDGTPVLLQPGRTFIELPRVGSTIVLPAS
ncbi:MAG: DUF3048 domain-containing protein [Ilumatobacteraceae bacterium]